MGYEVPEVEWLYPNEGSTGGGDILTVAGTNLGTLKRMKNVELRCRVDATETATSYLHDDLDVRDTSQRGRFRARRIHGERRDCAERIAITIPQG